MDDNNKINENVNRGSLGVRFSDTETNEEDQVSYPFCRKRSSLKPRSSVKPEEGSVNKTLKKRITWTSEVEENTDITASPEKNYNMAKTHFSEVVKTTTKLNFIINNISQIFTKLSDCLFFWIKIFSL